MRHFVLFVFVSLVSCGGDAPAPMPVPLETACTFDTDSSGAILCKGSPDGCICGVDDGCGHPSGGCVGEVCCTGCVTENADGKRTCDPGHGENGLFGSHGGHCTTTVPQ